MAPEELFSQLSESLNGEFLSKILHLLLLFYPIFSCVDPIWMCPLRSAHNTRNFFLNAPTREL